MLYLTYLVLYYTIETIQVIPLTDYLDAIIKLQAINYHHVLAKNGVIYG
jgi:hypothetical protein